jgi:hypothetical protein
MEYGKENVALANWSASHDDVCFSIAIAQLLTEKNKKIAQLLVKKRRREVIDQLLID